MLKIKLARFGKRNQPHYRIVVNEARPQEARPPRRDFGGSRDGGNRDGGGRRNSW